jgi:hypothetical protein
VNPVPVNSAGKSAVSQKPSAAIAKQPANASPN